MRTFDDLIHEIARRPAMFVGTNSLRAVSAYLDGYRSACRDLNHPDPLDLWPMFIYHRFLIWHSGWHWTRVLLHAYGNDSAAFDALPSLYHEYAAQRPNLSYETLKADLEAQLTSKYGKNWHEPESTHTTLSP